MLIMCNTDFMFELLKNYVQCGYYLHFTGGEMESETVSSLSLIPPERAADLKSDPGVLTKPILSAFLHSMLICLGYFFGKQNYVRRKLPHYLQIKYKWAQV